MPEREEPYSNPLAPPDHKHDDAEAHPMTNADFRKLLMTPRVLQASTVTPSSTHSTIRSSRNESERESIEDRMSSRRKKKSFYAKLKKQEEDKMAELARKYRDRAKERREGDNPDYQNVDLISSTAGYRAVAPDAKSGMDAAERRRQLIQESKFLGGDMEHTHLVKGLDYALLQKVRSEILSKELEEDEMDETFKSKPKDKDAEEEEQMQFKTKIAKTIYRVLFKNRYPERNELFLPGRMAYVIDLEDEYAESDIPTTLIRSKADCPSLESQTTLTTNDIVINKLTQILTYLRQGMRGNKKMKRKDKGKLKDDDKLKGKIEDIFPELAEYLFDKSSKEKDKEWDHEKEKEKERKYKSYFEKPNTEDDNDIDRDQNMNARELVKNINEKFSKSASMDPRLAAGWAPADISLQNDQESGINPRALSQEEKDKGLGSVFKRDDARMKLKAKLDRSIPDSYAECYPGAPETEDAVEDSDDEVDYTKMDMGNKKGPVGRWDFDTQEEYSDYMNQKEALPKAAFQYGVKMADGRKTRRAGTGKKDEKAELDREWQKISRIIAKRKAEESTDPGYKRPKY